MTTFEESSIKKWMVGVSTSLAVVLLVQTGTLIYWVGEMNGRVSSIEKMSLRNDERLTYLERLNRASP